MYSVQLHNEYSTLWGEAVMLTRFPLLVAIQPQKYIVIKKKFEACTEKQTKITIINCRYLYNTKL